MPIIKSSATFYISEPNPKDIPIDSLFFDDSLRKLSPMKLLLIGAIAMAIKKGAINKSGFWQVELTVENALFTHTKLYHAN